MPTPAPLLRLLSQERTLLTALRDLAARQEAALIAADVAALNELAAQGSGLVQREARVSHALQALRAGRPLPVVLDALPAEDRAAAQALLAELEPLAAELQRHTARSAALAEAGMTRVRFVYQALARGGQQPGAYTMQARPHAPDTPALLSRQV